MRATIALFFLLLTAWPSSAGEEFAATFRLRGGYDTNPLLAPQGQGSALIAWDAAAAYGKDNGEWIAGATGEASMVRYREEAFDPLQSYRLRLRLANKGESGISFDATATLAHFSSYDTKAESANQRVHLQWARSAWRPFVSGDLRLASLNELNVLLGEFLPRPLRYLRGTITPGVAFVKDKAEFGLSLALSETRYEERLDLFGFRRDNRRVQPALYAKFDGGDFSLAGAISHFHAIAEDADFSDVRAILFEVSLTASWDGWNAEAAIARTAEDTSFPVSPVTINTAAQAKLSLRLEEKTTAGFFARTLTREYWDSPFFSRVRVAGLEISRDLTDSIALAGEVGFSRALLLSGVEADGIVATLALAKRFGSAKK
jgi:hypothetical protein